MDERQEDESLRLMKERLYTAVVGDILDALGYFHQFFPQALHPLREEMKVAGRAMPVLMMSVFGAQEEPFGRMVEALDDLRPGEVYLAGGALPPCATWGEIMTAAGRARGAAGAVVYGYHRDTRQVLEQDFPVFSLGSWAQDSAPRMKVVDFRVPIEVGGVLVTPGDLVFGDRDGVLVVPKQLEEEVIRRAFEKAEAEKAVRKEIERGVSVAEAFRRHRVL